MKKNVNCPSCGSLKIQEVGPVPATNIFAGQVLPDLLPGGTLFYCENCGLRFKSPYVRPNEQGILYSQASLDHWGSSPAARADWSLAKEWIQAEFSQAAILDIGCFDGSFFSILSHPYTFFGIEINPQAAKRAAQTGIKILGSDFSVLAECDSDSFDAVTAFDVIEHVADPAWLLRQVARVVRPRGLIIISTGNALSEASRLMGSRYYYVSNAEHVSFISPQWCEMRSRELEISLEEERRFSHAILNTLHIKVNQIILNLVYRFFPAFFAWLRRCGFSDKNVNLHPELASCPPNWMTAKDHFIVKFRKQ